jgi:hypothetical protein
MKKQSYDRRNAENNFTYFRTQFTDGLVPFPSVLQKLHWSLYTG